MITIDPPPPGAPRTGAGPIRVAVIPSADPYGAAVLPLDAVRAGPHEEPSPWLDPAYLAAHAGEVDVLHLHGGFGHLGVDRFEGWTETVRRLGVPLVLTAHQLRDPEQPDRRRHDAHLTAALATAEVVFAPTPGAAEEIADRFGRTAIVVAYPSVVVPDPELGAERGLVGVRVGVPTPAVPDPLAVARAALSGALSGGGRLRLLVAGGEPLDPGLAALAAAGEAEVVRYPRNGLAAELQQLHVAVLPQRLGTHSRDLEVCRDVGTRVVAPSCGWFADQWSDVVTYGNDEVRGLDAVSLSAAVSAALARPMPRPADRTWREEQRAAVRRVHADVYAQVVADTAWA